MHGCHLPVHFNVQSVKMYQPHSSYLYREAVCLFNIFHWIKNSLDVVVVDCPDYCHLNGLTGKIQYFNKQTGQYIVAINSSGHCSSGSSTVVVHLCPYNMEPLYQVTEPGIKISSQVKDEEVVSIPNIFSVSEAINSQTCVKFHWQVFEQIRRRFVRPENTSNGLSCQALQDELSKLSHKARVRKQHVVSDQVEYASLFSNGARE